MSNEGYLGRELYSERMFPTKYDVLAYEVISRKTRVQIFQQVSSMLRTFTFRSKHDDIGSFYYGLMSNLKRRKGVTDFADLLSKASIQEMNRRSTKDYGVFSRDKDEGEFFKLLIYADEKDYLLILDMIDLLSYSVLERFKKGSSEKIDELINEVFRHNGIGYELVKGHVIHKGNEITHLEMIRPALLYLSDPLYSTANKEMLDAFSKFRENKFKDAIHQANKAFESTMKIIIHKNNWSIVNRNPKKKSPSVQAASANLLIDTILEHAQLNLLIDTTLEHGDLEKFHKIALEGMRNSLQTLASLRNEHGGHGEGNEIIETHKRHCEFALHMTASNIIYLIKTYG